MIYFQFARAQELINISIRFYFYSRLVHLYCWWNGGAQWEMPRFRRVLWRGSRWVAVRARTSSSGHGGRMLRHECRVTIISSPVTFLWWTDRQSREQRRLWHSTRFHETHIRQAYLAETGPRCVETEENRQFDASAFKSLTRTFGFKNVSIFLPSRFVKKKEPVFLKYATMRDV